MLGRKLHSGTSKTKKLVPVHIDLSGSPTVHLASQHVWFCILWPDCAKGLIMGCWVVSWAHFSVAYYADILLGSWRNLSPRPPPPPRFFFAPGKPEQNLKPLDYRAVLLSYPLCELRFSSCKKILDTDEIKMTLRPERFPRLSRNGPPSRIVQNPNSRLLCQGKREFRLQFCIFSFRFSGYLKTIIIIYTR